MTTKRKILDRLAQPAPTAPEGPERAAIDEARKRVANRRPRFTTSLDVDANGGVANIGPDHCDRDGWLARLDDVFGSNGRTFAISQLHHILNVARGANGYDRNKVNALLAAIEGARPADEVQAMLAVQLAVTHEMAMQAVQRAMRVDQIPQYNTCGQHGREAHAHLHGSSPGARKAAARRRADRQSRSRSFRWPSSRRHRRCRQQRGNRYKGRGA